MKTKEQMRQEIVREMFEEQRSSRGDTITATVIKRPGPTPMTERLKDIDPIAFGQRCALAVLEAASVAADIVGSTVERNDIALRRFAEHVATVASFADRGGDIATDPSRRRSELVPPLVLLEAYMGHDAELEQVADAVSARLALAEGATMSLRHIGVLASMTQQALAYHVKTGKLVPDKRGRVANAAALRWLCGRDVRGLR